MKKEVSVYDCPSCKEEVLVTNTTGTTSVVCVKCKTWMFWKETRKQEMNGFTEKRINIR